MAEQLKLDRGMCPEELGEKIKALMAIDPSKLGDEIQRGPKIYNDLMKLHRSESRIMRQWLVRQHKMERQRFKHYDGKGGDGKYYAEHPLPEPIMTKETIAKYMKIDPYMIELAEIVHDCEHKVKMIEDAMKRCTNRGYDIKTMMEWIKFQSGNY